MTNSTSSSLLTNIIQEMSASNGTGQCNDFQSMMGPPLMILKLLEPTNLPNLAPSLTGLAPQRASVGFECSSKRPASTSLQPAAKRQPLKPGKLSTVVLGRKPAAEISSAATASAPKAPVSAGCIAKVQRNPKAAKASTVVLGSKPVAGISAAAASSAPKAPAMVSTVAIGPKPASRIFSAAASSAPMAPAMVSTVAIGPKPAAGISSAAASSAPKAPAMVSTVAIGPKPAVLCSTSQVETVMKPAKITERLSISVQCSLDQNTTPAVQSPSLQFINSSDPPASQSSVNTLVREIRYLRQTLDHLIQSNIQTSSTQQRVEFRFNPLKNKDELELLNTRLGSDEVFRKTL